MRIKKSYISVLLLSLILVGAMGAKEFSFGKKEKATSPQNALQEGNRLLREFQYYKAAQEFERAGQQGIPNLNNIMNNYKDVYDAQKAVEENPKDLNANLALALVYQKRYENFLAQANPLAEHYFTLTENQYKKCMDVGGGQRAEPYKGLADLYFSMKKYDLAAENYSKATQAAPADLMAQVRLSQCYINVGKLQEAESVAAKVLTTNAGCAECYEIMGQLADKKGNTDAALKNYQMALKYNSNLVIANGRVNDIIDARTPKGFIKVFYNKEAAAQESVGMSDVDSGEQSKMYVSGGRSSSRGSYRARGSYDTSRYGSGSGSASGEGESSSSHQSMSGEAAFNVTVCRPDDIEVFAYSKANKRKYMLEDGVRSSIPEGAYTFYAAFNARCDKQFGEPWKAKDKTVYNKDFTMTRNQSMNLEVQMKADMDPKKCSVNVVQKKDTGLP